MPSPFPGMDPYLEHSARWPGMHQRLINRLSDVLNELLPPEYLADIGERLYVVQSRRSIYPDVMPIERSSPVSLPTASPAAGGTAVLTTGDPPWVMTVQPEEIREVFIEILTVADESQVVAVIEILSPANKATGSEGRQLYLAKQRELLKSRTHLVEIDLLRQGEHTVAAPLDWLVEQGSWDYLVSLHRVGPPDQFQAWPIMLRQPLPPIRVPLAEDDPDVVVDLQAVFDHCYDEGPYARRVDYRQEPPAPLPPADAEWAETLLRERRLRE